MAVEAGVEWTSEEDDDDDDERGLVEEADEDDQLGAADRGPTRDSSTSSSTSSRCTRTEGESFMARPAVNGEARAKERVDGRRSSDGR